MQALGVGLRRRYLKERNQLAACRQPVLDQRVVAELEQLLDPHPGKAQHLDHRPGPKGVLLLPVQQAPIAGCRIICPDVPRHAVRSTAANQGLFRRAELLAR